MSRSSQTRKSSLVNPPHPSPLPPLMTAEVGGVHAGGEGTVTGDISLRNTMRFSAESRKTDRNTNEAPGKSATAQTHPADLISQLLREQSTLTAVEEFSSWHLTHSEPEQAKYYRNLLPTAMPGPGQQLAFEVDLDQCSGCKACVVACHSLNGLDEGESFRDVGLLVSGDDATPLFQHVTTACHHCVDPGCLNACPVNAYEKDPVTGIVRHLDDQCFGCQYCTLACPYEVPKYHAAKGIVRKCDMCTQRLSTGEAPACVQACPHQAISIKTIDIAAVRADAAAGTFLANSPDPRITLPTTRFVGKATTLESMRAATYSTRPLEHAHWPLVLLLVLSQIAVGIVCLVFAGQMLNGLPESITTAGTNLALANFSSLERPFSPWQGGEGGRRPDEGVSQTAMTFIDSSIALQSPSLRPESTEDHQRSSQNLQPGERRQSQQPGTALNPILTALSGGIIVTILLAIAFVLAATSAMSSTLHLGRPQFAYRAILGIGHSWMSREIVAFGGFIPLCGLSALLAYLNSPWLSLCLAATTFFGITAVAASVMIYHVTHRPFWNAARSAPLFVSTVVGASSSIVLLALLLSNSTNFAVLRMLACLAGLSGVLKLAARHPVSSSAPRSESIHLLSTKLQLQSRLLTASGLMFLLMNTLLVVPPTGSLAIEFAVIALVAAVVADFSERYLFFRAVVPLRMPGVPK